MFQLHKALSKLYRSADAVRGRQIDRTRKRERVGRSENTERERDAVVERVSRVSVLEKQNTFTAHKLPRFLAHYLSLTLYLSHSISLLR